MRIAHVVWGMETGGVETMLVNIINEQVVSHKVSLFIINNFIEESIIKKISPQCIIKRINRRPKSKDYFKIAKMNFLIWLFRPDIIHVHSYRVSTLLKGRWRIVRTIHNTHNRTDEYPQMCALYAISNAVKDYTTNQGFPNVTVVENGIETKSFKKKKDYTIKDNIYHIVQVGRLFSSQKGQDILLRAISILVNKKNVKNFTLHFIGTGESEDSLKIMVNDLKISDHVCFEGFRDQDYIKENLCSYDLFVQPSRYEGFGLTVAEAMAAKVPVLVSDIEGPMEIIDNGKYGMHFKKEDAVDLANKLEIILNGGYDYSMIDPAYDYVKNHYDVSITAKKYIEEYKKVINKHS